jgi:hypothetical protein
LESRGSTIPFAAAIPKCGSNSLGFGLPTLYFLQVYESLSKLSVQFFFSVILLLGSGEAPGEWCIVNAGWSNELRLFHGPKLKETLASAFESLNKAEKAACHSTAGYEIDPMEKEKAAWYVKKAFAQTTTLLEMCDMQDALTRVRELEQRATWFLVQARALQPPCPPK